MPVIPCTDAMDKLLMQKLEDEPVGRKTRLREKEDKLADAGAISGAKAVFQMEDGKIFVRYGSAYGNAKVMYANENEAWNAMSVLRKDIASRLKLEAKARRAGEDLTFVRPERPVGYGDLAPDNPVRMDQLAHGDIWEDDLSKPGAYITGKAWDYVQDLVSPRQRLNSVGPISRTMVQQFQRVDDLGEKLIARLMLHTERSLDGVPLEEVKSGMRQMVENGAPGSPELRAAYTLLRQAADSLVDTAKAVGLKVEKLIDNYFPHVHAMRSLADEGYKEEVIGKLVDSGKSRAEAEQIIENSILGTDRSTALQALMKRHAQAGNPLTEAEAENILQRYVNANSTFISGHLERERVSSIPPIEDARTAWSVAFVRDAKRIAQAQVWGPNYEKAYALIDSIREHEGERAAQFAQRLFDLSIGREQTRLPDWLTGMMDWQNAKLSLSVISNMTQVPLNVPVRVGVGNTLRGMFDFISQDKWFQSFLDRDATAMAEHSREAASIVYGMRKDLQAYGMQSLYPKEEATSLLGKIATTTKDLVKDFSTRLFNYVETANRAIATRAGERYFDQQVERLIADPADALAIRRLREYFPSQNAIDEIVKRAQTGDDGLLNEFRLTMGKRISDETQFKTTALSRPLAAESTMGRVMYQFKQFTLQQAEFVARETMAFKHADDPARTMRMLGLGFTVFPAIAAAALTGREYLMGKSLTTDALHKAFSDPTFSNMIAAMSAAMLTTGTMGIMGDAVGTALVGNKQAIKTFLLPPTVSTALNTLEAGASAVKGAWMGGDRKELESSIRAISREFGGYGSILVKHTIGPAR